MPSEPYEEILKRAESELSVEQTRKLVNELAQRAGRKNTDSAHSIMQLKGLGKELWLGVDASDYVDKERNTWDG